MNCCALVFLGFIVLSPLAARAQWFSDSTTNTPVCVASSVQDYPVACTDGSNGAVIAWQDSRNGASAIYAQRMDVDGNPVWAKNGVLLSNTAGYNETNPVIASDGSGGAYVAWIDTRNVSTIYAQHIQANGTLAYPDSGKQIASGKNTRANPVICDDGAGGAFVAWEDSRATTGTFRPDIYMNHLSATSVKFGAYGSLIDGSKSTQRFPAICSDGSGGCFISWISGATIPSSVWAQHIDASGDPLWNTPGFMVFQKICGDCANANPSHTTISRDGKQLLLAWDIPSVTSSSDTEEIMAARIRNSTDQDTTHVWGHAIEVTPDMLYNQTLPQIFSDDSAVAAGSDFRGVLVPFENQKAGASDNWDVSMVRVLGNGTSLLPPSPAFYYDFATQTHGQVGFRAIQNDTGILAVWNDARYNGIGVDTCIYAQRLDRNGNSYLPTYKAYKSSNKLSGQAVCHGTWTAKHVTVAPRASGAIVAWTDYRAGSSDPNIYAQLIFRDGSLPIVLSSFSAECHHRGQVDLRWNTASEQENAGFEVQRRIADDGSRTLQGAPAEFTTIGNFTSDNSLRGAGSSNSELNYAWTDRNVEPAIYEYRLVEVALDGTRLEHDPRRVDARFGESVGAWSVGPNVPNPFLDQTVIPLTLPSSAIVDLAIFDVTGREVVAPIAHQLFAGGMHEVPIDGKQLGIESGSYFVRVVAYDPVTGELSWTSSAPVRISFVR